MANIYKVNITCPRCFHVGDVEADFPCGHEPQIAELEAEVERQKKHNALQQKKNEQIAEGARHKDLALLEQRNLMHRMLAAMLEERGAIEALAPHFNEPAAKHYEKWVRLNDAGKRVREISKMAAAAIGAAREADHG